MARIRTIKPEFFTSLTIAALPLTARMTFIGLWTHVDDYGRCVDDTRLIRAAIWALDDRTLGDVDDDLKALREATLIDRYEVGGRRYLVVSAWKEHQKISHPTDSKLPPPDSASKPPPTSGNAAIPEGSGISPEDSGNPPELLSPERKGKEQGTGNREGSSSAANASATTRGTRIPADFAVTPAMVGWANEHAPDVDGRFETAQFVDYWSAKSGKDAAKVDWVRTWQTWMRRAQRDAGRTKASRRGNGFQPFQNPTGPDAYNGYHNEPGEDDHAA